jgi:hypothetical protein
VGKIILVESMNDLTAKEIAIAIDDLGRCPCGNTSTAIFECESTNCGSNFCFLCMQKYIHGHHIIEHKFCEKHHAAEIRCNKLDYEFYEWEISMKDAIDSITVAKSALESSHVNLELMSKNKDKIVIVRRIGFIIIISSIISTTLFTNEDLIFGAFMLAVCGGVISLYPFVFNTDPIRSKENLEKVVLQAKILAQSMPDVTPPDRPVLVNRSLPNFHSDEVRGYVYNLNH